MANRYFTSQFAYSFERMQVELMGSFTQTDLGAFASLVNQGITYTADAYGVAGNEITITLVDDGTGGAETVDVSGSDIVVHMEAGVSTQTNIKTALDNSVAASALISVSVASGATTVDNALAETPLAGGDETDFTFFGSGFELSQIGTGLYSIIIPNKYQGLLSISIMLGRSSGAVDLVPQIVSESVSSSKLINFRLLAGSTPTNMANSDVLYISMKLRNSSQPSL